MMKNEVKRVILPALLTFIAFSLLLDLPDIEESVSRNAVWNLLHSFRGFRIEYALEFPCLVLLYHWIGNKLGGYGRRQWSIVLPSVLFALFVVVGHSFELTDSWQLAFGVENGQLLKAAVVFGGYYVLFKRLIAILFFLADRRLASGMESEAPAGNGRKTSWYFRKLEEAPFWTVFLTLAILYLPHCCISYPASFMGDTPDQIVQAFPELKTRDLIT